MTSFPEFFFEEITPGTKGVYQLGLPFGGNVEKLVEQINLASSGLSSNAQMHSEIARWVQNGTLSLPVLVARGEELGETLVVTSGIHGDEYEGIEAVYRIFEALDPRQMRGTFVCVPVASLPAFWLGTRCNPVDSRNLARVFPGTDGGSATEQLAAILLNRVLRHATLYVDLHSAGRNYHMLTLCGYCTVGSQSARAAEAASRFGAPVIWQHPRISPGRTMSATLDLEIPSLYTEALGGGHVRSEDIQVYTRGLCNLLQFLEIATLAESIYPTLKPLRIGGEGDLDDAINCRSSGMFFSDLAVGDRVKEGDVLGTIRGLDGQILETVRASQSGVLVLLRATPRLFGGELVAVLANEDSSVPSLPL
jgi:uncharacterized protein